MPRNKQTKSNKSHWGDQITDTNFCRRSAVPSQLCNCRKNPARGLHRVFTSKIPFCTHLLLLITNWPDHTIHPMEMIRAPPMQTEPYSWDRKPSIGLAPMTEVGVDHNSNDKFQTGESGERYSWIGNVLAAGHQRRKLRRRTGTVLSRSSLARHAKCDVRNG